MANKAGGIRTWLFNPQELIAGWRALALGLLILATSGGLGWLTHSHFDGLLDLHTGLPAPLLLVISEGFVDWGVFAFLAYLGAWTLSQSRVRAVDVFGAQALARFPYLPAVAILLLTKASVKQCGQFMLRQSGTTAALPTPAPTLFAWLAFGLSSIACVFAAFWMVYLMWRAFSASCAVKGAKAIAVFCGALILGEILTKLAVLKILQGG